MNVIFVVTLITSISSAIVAYILPLIFKKYHEPANWTRYKFCLTGVLIILLTIPPSSFFAYKVYLYGGLEVNYTLDKVLFYWYPIGFFIGAVPTLIIYSLTKKRSVRIKKKNKGIIVSNLNKEHVGDNNGMSANDIEIALYGNTKDKFVLSFNCFLYGEAQRNYVTVFYIKDDKVERTLLRTTLSHIAEALQQYPQIIRCHRSFIVNLSHVRELYGNSRTCSLKFHKNDIQIPVARSYIKDIKEILNI
ncbi:LytTR family DNA-binding domain-containing protein [Prevotella sp. 10(H)]|uniref:LytR/AlgR family response regulator transcription factor n=1 Tax=Prevotella sp. 10(H) TaxID=1158294 RepID=UPI0004A73A00|nr:LytTR family DNA-binding domain-containing protein [Prevotella sp. 10(H)]